MVVFYKLCFFKPKLMVLKKISKMTVFFYLVGNKENHCFWELQSPGAIFFYDDIQKIDLKRISTLKTLSLTPFRFKFSIYSIRSVFFPLKIDRHLKWSKFQPLFASVLIWMNPKLKLLLTVQIFYIFLIDDFVNLSKICIIEVGISFTVSFSKPPHY